jgi:hypothetical protein
MKKYFTTFSLAVLTVILFSCNNKNPKENTNQTSIESSDSLASKLFSTKELDSIVSLIIDISANDFYKNQQPAPVNFSDVKLKYIKKENGEELYILCGQFITSDKKATQFATVKNSDYEQWVGTSALTYCQDSKLIQYTKSDLSSALKSKFDSLKK